MNYLNTYIALVRRNAFRACFNVILIQTLFKGQHSSISGFFTYHYLKMASKIGNISKFTKELEIFTNWTVHGTQYTFHENWL